jgi:hypothetical protein
MILGDQHYRAIGRISVMFSDVEIWTSAFIWQLIGSEQNIGQIVTARMSFSRQLDLLASLFRHRFPDPALIKPLQVLIKRICALEQKRNTVLHSSWILQSLEQNEVIRFKMTATRKKGLHRDKEITRPEELDAIADEFERALTDFIDFMIPVASTLDDDCCGPILVKSFR